MKKKVKLYVALVAGLVISCLIGCQTSQSFQTLVKRSFPVVADRMEGLGAPAEAEGLRAAAKDPVTLDAAEPAWQKAAPVYRQKVADAPNLWPLRKQQWLETADIIDRGMEKEHAYRQKVSGR
jgi:hypothetical protein